MKKIVLIIIILCIGLGIAGYWYWQKNPYSKEILKLEILGPEEIEAFQEVEYTVKYKNNGNVRLEEPRLIFEFPQQTLLGEDVPLRQEIEPDELGDIYPGEEKTFKFKGRIFGKEGDLKTIKAWLNYRPKDLQARYESTTTFTTKIKSVPITFDFDLPSKVEAGRDFDFSLNYYSNSDYPLSSLSVRAEYPSGFEFLESKPKGLEKIEWDIPLLNQAEGGRVEIRGKLIGGLGDQKTFKASFGIWLEDEFILLKEITRGVNIAEPQISIFQQINSRNQYVASPGDLLHYEIYFRNISTEPFKDLFLVTKLSGSGFDFETIKAQAGQFEKGDNSIIWDWRTVPKLKFLGQGEEGKVEFWVDLRDQWSISSPEQKNAILKNTVLISQVEEEFEIKVNSKLEIFQTFNPSTSTITWQAKNYLNDVKNVKVKAILPLNIKLTGQVSPASESPKFTFDSGSREIVWMVGDMETGKGILNEAPTISFQISLDSGQIIINEVTISGEDQWTGMFVESKTPAVFK